MHQIVDCKATEQGLIAAVMAKQSILDELPPIKPEHFWSPKHEELWALILDQNSKGRKYDVITLSDLLPPGGTDTGLSATYIAEIMDQGSFTTAHAVQYARTTILRFIQRSGSNIGVKLQQAADELSPEEFGEQINGAIKALQTVADGAAYEPEETVADILANAIPEWMGEVSRDVIPTGWSELDDHLNGGWVPGQLTVVGARPAVGKSLMATCAALAAVDSGVAFFSLEMSNNELLARMTSSFTGIPLGKLMAGVVDPSERHKLVRFAEMTRAWPFRIKSKAQMSVAYMRSVLRAWMRETPIKVVVIDYAQIAAPADQREMRERQVSRIAEDCKALARDLDVHVILLAQVNRSATMTESKRPNMAQLRESGGLEAAADNIILLHRPETAEGDAQIIEFIIEKNRHGRTGRVDLVYRPDLGSIQSMGMSEDDFPFGRPERIARRLASQNPTTR